MGGLWLPEVQFKLVAKGLGSCGKLHSMLLQPILWSSPYSSLLSLSSSIVWWRWPTLYSLLSIQSFSSSPFGLLLELWLRHHHCCQSYPSPSWPLLHPTSCNFILTQYQCNSNWSAVGSCVHRRIIIPTKLPILARLLTVGNSIVKWWRYIRNSETICANRVFYILYLSCLFISSICCLTVTKLFHILGDFNNHHYSPWPWSQQCCTCTSTS